MDTTMDVCDTCGRTGVELTRGADNGLICSVCAAEEPCPICGSEPGQRHDPKCDLAHEPCPECGAPGNEPHDPGCPLVEPQELDPDRYREGAELDESGFEDDDLPDLHGDDPESQEYLQTGPECPQCHGENTDFEGGPPSMMDHGTTKVLHCRDCDAEFEMDPFTGELAEGKLIPQGVAGFDRFMDATLIKETHQRKAHAALSPQRQLARGYQEHPLGRVRIGRSR